LDDPIFEFNSAELGDIPVWAIVPAQKSKKTPLSSASLQVRREEMQMTSIANYFPTKRGM
jgi:hypothetical protein